MVELLNLLWLAMVATMFVAVARQRRDAVALVAVLAIAVLLFPIVSASDDFLGADQLVSKVFAAVLGAVALCFALSAQIFMSRRPRRIAASLRVTHADPRSPPLV